MATQTVLKWMILESSWTIFLVVTIQFWKVNFKKCIFVFTLKKIEEKYLTPTQESGRNFMMRKISGSVVMLNLLRFREFADYLETPELAPKEKISGEQAYQLYIKHTLPHLEKSGGEIVFMGKGGNFLVGPTDERWDAVLLICQQSVESFMAFAQDKEYMKGIGHRSASLEDSRLLPLVEENS